MNMHLIFDIDGTLVDSREANRAVLRQLVRELLDRDVADDEADACFGLADGEALARLGIRDIARGLCRWEELIADAAPAGYALFPGIRALVQNLACHGVQLGLVTSKSRVEFDATFTPLGLNSYFGNIVCSDDTQRHKPDPAPLLHYLALTGADRASCLYVGDTSYDMQAANAAGIPGGLALWGGEAPETTAAAYRFEKPSDLLACILPQKQLSAQLRRIVEIQMMAQAGLAYSRDPYDIDRFHVLRRLAAEMLAEGGSLPVEQIETLFCSDEGYPTPKLDSRAAIFDGRGRILLVQEKNEGTWSLPGGWVDVNLSVAENLVKEVREEAGLDVVPGKLVALLDRNRHNTPPFAYGVAKAFLICHVVGGRFEPNIEIAACGYFSRDSLPELSVTRNTKEQIELCFRAQEDPRWEAICD